MSAPSRIASDHLNAFLGTVVAARPGQVGAPLGVFVTIVAILARMERPLHDRAVRVWHWHCQHREVMFARNN